MTSATSPALVPDAPSRLRAPGWTARQTPTKLVEAQLRGSCTPQSHECALTCSTRIGTPLGSTRTGTPLGSARTGTPDTRCSQRRVSNTEKNAAVVTGAVTGQPATTCNRRSGQEAACQSTCAMTGMVSKQPTMSRLAGAVSPQQGTRHRKVSNCCPTSGSAEFHHSTQHVQSELGPAHASYPSRRHSASCATPEHYIGSPCMRARATSLPMELPLAHLAQLQTSVRTWPKELEVYESRCKPHEEASGAGAGNFSKARMERSHLPATQHFDLTAFDTPSGLQDSSPDRQFFHHDILPTTPRMRSPLVMSPSSAYTYEVSAVDEVANSLHKAATALRTVVREIAPAESHEGAGSSSAKTVRDSECTQTLLCARQDQLAQPSSKAYTSTPRGSRQASHSPEMVDLERENKSLRKELCGAVQRLEQLEGERRRFFDEGIFDLLNIMCRARGKSFSCDMGNTSPPMPSRPAKHGKSEDKYLVAVEKILKQATDDLEEASGDLAALLVVASASSHGENLKILESCQELDGLKRLPGHGCKKQDNKEF